MEVDVFYKIKKEVVIKSEVEDDSTVDDLIEDDNRNVITISVKKELESEIPLPSFPLLPNEVSSSPFEVHNSSTGGLPESSVKVEDHDCSAKVLPESSGKVNDHKCSARELRKSSREINNPSSESQKLRAVIQDRISAGAFDKEGTVCSRDAKIQFGSTVTDVPVKREDAVYNSTQNTSRNTRESQRKKRNAQKRQRKKRNTQKRQGKKLITKNQNCVPFPVCERDSQESVNGESERVGSSCIRETDNINDDESMVEIIWVSGETLCSEGDLEIDRYVTHNKLFPSYEEKEDPISLNFIPEAKNTVRKIINPSLDEINGQRRSKTKKKSESRKIVNEEKLRNSYSSICVENGAKQKLEKLIESQSHRKSDKTKPDSTVGIREAPIQRPKEEVGSPSKFRICSDFATERTCSVKVPSAWITAQLDEEKPKRKLRPKVHHCEQCPSTFSRMDYLKLHVMHHTNEKPFKCDVCAKGFRMRWRVKLHRATHFEDKPHCCKFCSYRSIRRDALLSHAKRMHKNVIVCGKKECLVDHAH